jgi:hypothetical protein
MEKKEVKKEQSGVVHNNLICCESFNTISNGVWSVNKKIAPVGAIFYCWYKIRFYSVSSSSNSGLSARRASGL